MSERSLARETENEDAGRQTEREAVASYRHLVLFLVIVAVVVFAGHAAQNRGGAGEGLTDSHSRVIPIYFAMIVLNGLLVFFVWRGLKARGTSVRSVIRGRWSRGRDVLRDVVIAFGFWCVLLAVSWFLHRLVGHGGERSLEILLPRSPIEVVVWLANSITAGFCEELVFRGYLQRQLLAISGRRWLAVLGQAVVFGLMHAYQGFRPVLRICVLGVLFGALAVWRRNLRVGMMAHAWQDIWAGWLGAVMR